MTLLPQVRSQLDAAARRKANGRGAGSRDGRVEVP